RHVHPAALPGWERHRRRRERRQALQPAADDRGRGAEGHVRPGRRRAPDRPTASAKRRLPRHVHRLADRDPGGRARNTGRAAARRAHHAGRVPGSVRIAYDVTPLPHPRTGVGNYILGALEGMVEVGGHELVAFGPVSIRGRKLLEDTLSEVQVERKVVTVPFAHATRRAWGR